MLLWRYVRFYNKKRLCYLCGCSFKFLSLQRFRMAAQKKQEAERTCCSPLVVNRKPFFCLFYLDKEIHFLHNLISSGSITVRESFSNLKFKSELF